LQYEAEARILFCVHVPFPYSDLSVSSPILGGYDELETLSYQIPRFGHIGADVRQPFHDQGTGHGLFANAFPVGRGILARVVGQGASIETLIGGISSELAERACEIVPVADARIFRTKTQFADTISAATDQDKKSVAFTETEMGVPCAIAYHQPIDRVGLKGILARMSVAICCRGFGTWA